VLSSRFWQPLTATVGLHLARGAQSSGWRVDRVFPRDSRFVSECCSFCVDRVQFRDSRSRLCLATDLKGVWLNSAEQSPTPLVYRTGLEACHLTRLLNNWVLVMHTGMNLVVAMLM